MSSRSRTSRRRVPIIRSQTAFAFGACGGLRRIRIPAAVPDQEPGGIGAVLGVHQEITGGLGGPGAVGAGGDAGQVRAAGAVLDDDQGVDSPE
jgi:hypothetical protein